ncbi:hypothetical protein GGR56DRAFT_640538 [Xylariaceae sp. FL0804]|nr:hypothetical protein GGR56DRAFT_640538 [Xylariaceae sp. FL0804]
MELPSFAISAEPICVLQSLLLVMVSGCKSTDLRNYQDATSMSPLLVEAIRCRKVPTLPPESSDAGTTLTERWLERVDFETTVRTICAIYIFLGTLEVTFDTATGMRTLDVAECFLPCEENEWMSASPKAWLGIRQANNCNPYHPTRFSAAMEMLSSPSPRIIIIRRPHHSQSSARSACTWRSTGS